MSIMKCIKCAINKLAEDFYICKRYKSGRLSVCKKCHNKRAKKYRTPESTRRHNQKAYHKAKNNKETWMKRLYKQREYYKIHGRKRHAFKCEICKKVFYSSETRARFCSRICADLGNSGIKNKNWKNGISISNGYIYILTPFHPYARRGYVLQHRLVMEKKLKRFLTPQEVVHHINFNTKDNRIENLMLFPNQQAHRNYHVKIIKRDEFGGRIADPNRQPRKIKIKF